MTQEDKDLLLKDLCTRLPYGVKVRFDCIITSPAILKGINKDLIECDIAVCELEDIKPYLFPLSSITEEQRKEMHNYSTVIWNNSIDSTPYEDRKIYCAALEIEWLNKNHFDYRGLIEKGSAIDATGLNIY